MKERGMAMKIEEKYMEIKPSLLKGTVKAPPSKSMGHRLLIGGALASGKTCIKNMGQSADIDATASCLEKMGAIIKQNGSTFQIKGCERPSILPKTDLFCNESGSTLRFLIPIAALSGSSVTFSGQGRLIKRPISTYFPIFKKSGIEFIYKDALPLDIKGTLKSGKYEILGNVSSQFLSGLLMALPLCEGDSEILLTSNLESRPYVEMTLNVLEKFGISIINQDYHKFFISGSQKYRQIEGENEGDHSQAAFWAVAAAIGKHPLRIENINLSTGQGDSQIFSILEKMGAQVNWDSEGVTIYPENLKNIKIDVRDIPDLVPILAVLGTAGEGIMEIVGGQRVRLKESDRLAAISKELNKMGAYIEETEDGLLVHGKGRLLGGAVDGWGDHRIVMALTIANLICENSVKIYGWQAVEKSYPDFFDVYRQLGGQADERHMG